MFIRFSKDFFYRLCRINPEARYNSEEALSHPWITRNFDSNIPLSIYDEARNYIAREDLLAIVRSLVFVSMLPLVQVYLDSPASRNKIKSCNPSNKDLFDFNNMCERKPIRKLATFEKRAKKCGMIKTVSNIKIKTARLKINNANNNICRQSVGSKIQMDLKKHKQSPQSALPNSGKLVPMSLDITEKESYFSSFEKKMRNNGRINFIHVGPPLTSHPHRTSAFAPPPQIKKDLNFSENQEVSFRQIAGLKELKLKRSLMTEADAKRSTKLIPLGSKIRFIEKGNVLSVGNHKYFH